MSAQKDTSSNVVINIVELTSELAHDASRNEMIENGQISNEEEMHKTIKNEEDILVYTDDAQNVFNYWYDYFWNKIESCVI